MDAADLAALDATAQATLVRTGEVSPAELVDAAIARIERSNPELNAVIVTMFDEARAEARGDLPAGPFRGVPILIKDIIATVAGQPYTMGTRPLKAIGHRAARDSWLVESLRAAGFVIVGKTNSSELGILPNADTLAWGATRNPWNPAHIPGGSSGGAAAAVAAGMVPVAHANDGGGSIRIPASCCGLVGLKPSRGRVSLGPERAAINGGLVAEHVVARSVRDSAAILDLIAGDRPGDPYVAPAQLRPYLEEVGAPVGRLRIGFTSRHLDPNGNVIAAHPACVAAVAATAARLEALGHIVEEAEIEALHHPDYISRFLAIWATGVAADLDGIEEILGRKVVPEEIEPLTWTLAAMGRSITGPAYVASWRWLQANAREVAGFWADHDVWLTPTLSAPPPAVGAFRSTPSDPLSAIFAAAEYAAFTPPFNVTGQPAISLPMHVADGLPIGVQLVGALGREDLLLRLSAQLEAAAPFVHGATRR